MSEIHFGGAFNPIHHGHLLCARAAAEAFGAARIILVPTGSPPHKSANAMAPAADRLEMCRRAIGGIPGFTVDDREVRQVGRSYTIRTVRQLKGEGAAEVVWLIGADQVLDLPTWHEAASLVEETRLLVMARPGWALAWESLPLPFQRLKENVIPAPLIDISATSIRQRIRAGLPIDFLTPPAVVQYIHDRRLYRTV